MKRLLFGFAPALLLVMCGLALAQTTDSDSADTDSDHPIQLHRHHHRHHADSDDQVMSVGSDSHLPAGARADSVVSMFGTALSEGEANQVLSFFGATRVIRGHVTNDATSVFGSTYVDSKVDGDTMAILGDLDLGPHAEIGGDVVVVGGTLTRDPAAIVHGEVQTVLMSQVNAHFEWLRTWARHCLLYGRPLAIAPGLGWAWILALTFLALYLALAAIFPGGITRCVQTFEAQPGLSFIASILGLLGAPIVLVLLCLTVVGIAAIPFVVATLFCAGLFGKAVMLAWLGTRVLHRRDAGLPQQVLAVLIGGLIVLLLYLVPVVGFLVYKLLGFLGFGIVVLTLTQAVRSRRASVDRGMTSGSAPGVSTSDAATAPGAGAAPGVEATPAAQMSAAEPAAAAATAASANSAALPRAGFWIRMIALLIDVVLVGIVLNIVHHAANLEFLALAVYGAVMWKLRGATIGGIVFDLQVVRQDGREMDWATSIVRGLGCFLSLAAAGIGFIWIAFDGGKQAWHDKIAGTVVVRTTRRVSLV